MERDEMAGRGHTLERIMDALRQAGLDEHDDSGSGRWLRGSTSGHRMLSSRRRLPPCGRGSNGSTWNAEPGCSTASSQTRP